MIHSVVPEGETWTLRFEAYGYYTEEVPFTLEKDQVLRRMYSSSLFPEAISRNDCIQPHRRTHCWCQSGVAGR